MARRASPVSLDDLEKVYYVWPAPAHDKTRLRALLLRIRLTMDDRTRRHRVVAAAIATYRELCDLLHARRADLHVSVQDIDSCAAAVAAIDAELVRRIPNPRSVAQRGDP